MASRIGVLGWVTGVLSAVLGTLAFGAVLCLWFPAVLTTPALRDVYPMEIVRTTIKITLGVAFVLGLLSIFLKRRKALGTSSCSPRSSCRSSCSSAASASSRSSGPNGARTSGTSE
jgi:hypothetical protein